MKTDEYGAIIAPQRGDGCVACAGRCDRTGRCGRTANRFTRVAGLGCDLARGGTCPGGGARSDGAGCCWSRRDGRSATRGTAAVVRRHGCPCTALWTGAGHSGIASGADRHCALSRADGFALGDGGRVADVGARRRCWGAAGDCRPDGEPPTAIGGGSGRYVGHRFELGKRGAVRGKRVGEPLADRQRTSRRYSASALEGCFGTVPRRHSGTALDGGTG